MTLANFYTLPSITPKKCYAHPALLQTWPRIERSKQWLVHHVDHFGVTESTVANYSMSLRVCLIVPSTKGSVLSSVVASAAAVWPKIKSVQLLLMLLLQQKRTRRKWCLECCCCWLSQQKSHAAAAGVVPSTKGSGLSSVVCSCLTQDKRCAATTVAAYAAIPTMKNKGGSGVSSAAVAAWPNKKGCCCCCVNSLSESYLQMRWKWIFQFWGLFLSVSF